MAHASRATGVPAIALTICASLGLAACSSDGDGPPPRKPAQVGLKVTGVDDVTIGVVVSSTSAAGQGADYTGPSAGAELAAYRLRLGGSKVGVTVVDDQGDADETTSVVEDLIGRGVSGIVMATSGSHVLPALETASDAGVPVLAPYLRTTDDLPDGVYVTGPSEAAITAGIRAAMDADEVSSPFVVSADGLPVPTVGDGPRATFSGSALDEIVDDVADAVADDTVDSVVVSGAASSQAAVVAGLQGVVPDVPVYLTPEALTPAFTRALDDGPGTTSGRFVAVGAPASDTSTLGSSTAAESAAAYFAALRLAANDESVTSALDESAFAEVAAEADLPSHDALLALVRAASAARSAEPARVATALDGLSVGVKELLAGPALSFTSTYALPDTDVTPLHATTQDPGVRPAGDTPVLTWFQLSDDDT